VSQTSGRKSGHPEVGLRLLGECTEGVWTISQFIRADGLEASVNIAERSFHDHSEPHDLTNPEGGAVVHGKGIQIGQIFRRDRAWVRRISHI
jgi:hypothetical protein